MPTLDEVRQRYSGQAPKAEPEPEARPDPEPKPTQEVDASTQDAVEWLVPVPESKPEPSQQKGPKTGIPDIPMMGAVNPVAGILATPPSHPNCGNTLSEAFAKSDEERAKQMEADGFRPVRVASFGRFKKCGRGILGRVALVTKPKPTKWVEVGGPTGRESEPDAVLMFGQHRGKRVSQLVVEGPDQRDYLRWVLREDFGEDLKALIIKWMEDSGYKA